MESISTSSTGINSILEPLLNDSLLNSQTNEPKIIKEEEDSNRKSTLWNIIIFLFFSSFCLDIGYFGFDSSLVLFFEKELKLPNAKADIQYSYWSSLSFGAALIGAIIGDSILSRYKTIAFSYIIVIVGFAVTVFSIFPNKLSIIGFYIGIYAIVIGGASIDPNLSVLGASQFDLNYVKDQQEKDKFFSMYYFVTNVAAIIAYTLIAYICQNGLSFLGGPDNSFLAGYGLGFCFTIIGIIFFFLGSWRYRTSNQTTQLDVFTKSFRIIFQAYISRFNDSRPETKYIIDKAKFLYGGSFESNDVDAVKSILRLIPFYLSQIPYWGVYTQMATVFQNQGCQMNLNLHGFIIPISLISIFDSLMIILLIPVFDYYIYPFFKRINRPLKPLDKIIIGYGIIMIAMLIAALVEYYRLQKAAEPHDYYNEEARNNITPCQDINDYNPYEYRSYIAGDKDDAPLYCLQVCDDIDAETNLLALACIQCDNIPQQSHLSILYQIFQFGLIGTSEILASIPAYDFYFDESPTNMRSIAQAFNSLTVSLGMLSIIPLVLLVNINENNEWLPVNIDDGHLVYYFLVLAFVMIANMIYFYFISSGFVYKSDTIINNEINEKVDTIIYR